jgi:RNA polymerase sigma-70 factor (ECF subfamily)
VLNDLPAPLHQIFSLHYQEELTIPQIAEIVGVPEGTVKSRLHKTMNIIRKKLKQYENN